MIITERLLIKSLNSSVIEEMKHWNTEYEGYIHHQRKLAMDPSLQGWNAWVIQLKDGPFIGEVTFKGKPSNDNKIEISYYIEPSYRHQGYATESTQALIDRTLRYYPELIIFAVTLKNHHESERVLQNVAFELIDEDECFNYWQKNDKKS